MTNFVAISDARANLPTLINRVAESLEKVFITVNGQPKAVVISAEELASLEETAGILAIPGAGNSIRRGLKEAKQGLGVPLKNLSD